MGPSAAALDLPCDPSLRTDACAAPPPSSAPLPEVVIVVIAVCGGPAIVVPQRLGEVDVHLRGGARQVRRAETCIRKCSASDGNTLENSKVVYGQIAPLSFAVIVHVRLR